jgi:hypothetical protein
MVPPSPAASAPLAQAPRPQPGPQPGQVLVVQGREVPRMGWAMVVVVSKWGLCFVVMWEKRQPIKMMIWGMCYFYFTHIVRI